MSGLFKKFSSWAFATETHAILILWLLIVAVFFPVLAAEYVDFDEHETILANPAVTSSLSIASLRHIFTSFNSNQYTPLSIASHWLEYNLVGFNSALSHLINLVLHMLAAAAVLLLAVSLLGSIPAAWLAAAFWAVHPLQTDTVAWVLERRNLLYGMFFFASMLSYTAYVDTKRRRYLALGTVAILLSGFSKTLAFTLPFFWLLIDWVKDRPRGLYLLREKWVAGLLSTVLIVLLFAGAFSGIPKNTEKILHWKNAAYALSFYPAKTILPTGLSPTFEENASTAGMFDRGFLYLLTFMVIAALMSWRNRAITTGFIFYLVNIIPLSGLVRVGYSFYVSCHFVYVALWGLIMALTFWARDVASGYVDAKKLWLAGFVVLLSFSAISFSHSGIWQNSISLFEHALQVDPQGKFARNQLAAAFIKEKRFAEAEYHYAELVRRYPDFYSGYNGLGLLYSRRGEYDKAMANFDRAIELGEGQSVSLQNRGMLRFATGDLAGAEADFTASLANNPDNLKTRFHRVELRARCGQYQAAIADIVEVIARQPGNLSPVLRQFELLLEAGSYYSAADLFLTMLATVEQNGISPQAFAAQIFYPTARDFFRRIGPFRSMIRHRFGWYPF